MEQSHRVRLEKLFQRLSGDDDVIKINTIRSDHGIKEYLILMDEKKRGTIDLEQFITSIERTLRECPDIKPDELIDDFMDWVKDPKEQESVPLSLPEKKKKERKSSSSKERRSSEKKSSCRGERRLLGLLEKFRVRHIHEKKIITRSDSIGKGHFASVIVGKYVGTVVAVKRFRKSKDETLPSRYFQDVFLREVEMLSLLHHPNIIRLIGASASPTFLVTEICQNGNLMDYLRKSSDRPPLSWVDRISISLDEARALAFMHSYDPPILHRDLKSLNLLLDRHLTLKICDFGLCRKMARQGESMTREVGTLQWMVRDISLQLIQHTHIHTYIHTGT